MHIIIVGTAYPYRGGGTSTFNERLAKAFIDNGDKIEIFNFTLQYPKIFFPGKFQYSKELQPTELTIKRKINSINPYNWLKIGNELKNIKADLVLFRYWTPFMAACFGTIARRIKKNNYTKIIAITDNIIPHERMPFDRLLTKYFVNSMHAFITMSKVVMNDLMTLDQHKPKKFTPHPLYDNFGKEISKTQAKRHLNLENDVRYILFFGFIRKYKGLDLLIKAFADDKLRNYNIKLIVAGEFYTDPNPYFNLIKKYQLQDLVIMHNKFISNSDVVKYFCAADLVVQPYKEATQSGITQTAYHFNKPMITTNVGGLPEMVPDQKVGFVVQPDANEISNAIQRFLNLPPTFFLENIKREKQKYTWEKMIESIIELMKIIKKDNKK